jgi:serine/threonine-protein kinase RsbW
MTTHAATRKRTEEIACVTVRAPAEFDLVLGPVIDAMVRLGYPGTDVFAVRLAVDEALTNAFKHGHQGDAGRPIRVRFQVTGEQIQVEVADEGPGFDPAGVADPRSAEGLQRTSGRGLYLMRCCMSSVRHNERGNVVTLCKRRGR